MPEEKTRSIEMAVARPSTEGDRGDWDTMYVDIPIDTPEDKIEEVALAVTQEELSNQDISQIWLFNIPEIEEPRMMADSNELDRILDPEDFGWIGVKAFREVREDTAFGNYKRLTVHHKEETEALLTKCRELAGELKQARQSLEDELREKAEMAPHYAAIEAQRDQAEAQLANIKTQLHNAKETIKRWQDAEWGG